MRVLSLFDGCSVGYLALKKLGFIVDYFSSEIDKYAIFVSKNNHPDIFHVGDVKNVRGFDYGFVDLILAGSPCQGFSKAGNQLNFEHEESKLFFEFVRVLNEVRSVNPNVFFFVGEC